MPHQNRVTPDGRIIAVDARGTLMGNRGILHDENRQLGRSRWKNQGWVACRLAFKGRKRELMAPGRYTELFFLDEAVSLAAGHRPCVRCRPGDYRSFHECWSRAHPGRDWRAADIDRQLHACRVIRWRREQVTYSADLAALPDGVFVQLPGETSPMLLLGARLLPYSPDGYGAAVERRAIEVTVLTPEPTVRTLAAGYRPAVHATAGDGR